MSEIKVYTIEEVAELLHTTRRTLYTYLKAGKLKAVKRGRKWRRAEENLRGLGSKGARGGEEGGGGRGMRNREMIKAALEEYRAEAEELGLSLQEYLLLLTLEKLEDIQASAGYPGEG